jgi:putative ABC transport system permease protein
LGAAFGSLATHKLRTALATLGIVFGVGAVVAMLAIGAGAEKQALGLVERLGLGNVIVRAKRFDPDEAQEVRRKSAGLAARDALALIDAVPGAVAVVPKIRLEIPRVVAAGTKADATVFGVAPEHADLARLELAEGRFLDAHDQMTHAQVAVLGPSVRRDLFGSEPALGQPIKIGDIWLTVVGVLASSAAGGASGEAFEGVSIGSAAREIYLPASTAERKFERDPLASPYDEIVVRLADGADPRRAAVALGELLSRLHAGAEDYEIVVPEALLEQSRKTQRLFTIVMGAIAGISLLVGGIGIMNILLATVLERTREIGVRRAVGARRKDIGRQFLAEAFAISIVGAVAGVLLGLGLGRVVSAVAGWPTVVTLPSILLAAGVALAVGLASGTYPANRAAKLDPIDALRWE